MPGYAISLIPLMSAISSPDIKHVAFADDLTGGGTIKRLRLWWESVLAVGPSLGYYVNPKKSWLIVKSKYLNESLIEFKNSGLNITCDGSRTLTPRTITPRTLTTWTLTPRTITTRTLTPCANNPPDNNPPPDTQTKILNMRLKLMLVL